MPDQTIPPRLDLAGLHAGDVVQYEGVFYDVQRAQVEEKLGGRDTETGAPQGIETYVSLHLMRARWIDAPWIEPPTEFLVLPSPLPVLAISGRIVIGKQAYWIWKHDLATVVGPGYGDDPEPTYIDLDLMWSAHESSALREVPRG